MKADLAQENKRLAIKLALLAAGMLGFSIALIPLYDVFTQVSGVNGKVALKVDAASLNYTIDESRQVALDFIVVNSADSVLDVQLATPNLRVNPGRVSVATYELHNLAAHAIKLRTVVSTAPGEAASYVNLIDCICFDVLPLNVGERRRVELRFVVNPALPHAVKNLSFAQQFFSIK